MNLRQRLKNVTSLTNSDNTEQNGESQQEGKIQEFDGNWEEPRSNEIGIGITNTNLGIEQAREYQGDDVFRRIKNSPEIISIMQAVIDDIIGSGVKRYNYVGRTDNAENPGKRSKEDARRFWKQNKELIGDSIMDAMAMGDGYLYKKTLDEEQASEAINKHITKNYDFNHDEYKSAAHDMLINKFSDRLSETEDLELVPASTVEHDIDEFGNIERFVQEIGTEEYDLNPDKIIHHSYQNFDGRTYGFTPVAALFAELDMLANAKDYNGVKFDNAAVTNKIYKLPNDGPNGQNFEMVKQTLEKYRQMQNKHRDLVLTGEIEIEEMSDSDEMEFRELAEYVTRVIIMAWGVPPSRIGGIIGSDGATQSAMAQAGYNKRIKRMQDKYETILNDEIFEPMFNIRIELENPDTKEDIRKAELDLRKTEVVKQRMSIGAMSKEQAAEYLGINMNEMAEMDEEEMIEAAQGTKSAQEDMASDSSINQENAEETVNEQIREGVQENQ